MGTRVLITGSRGWTDRASIRSALANVWDPDAVLVSGRCRHGADDLCEACWQAWSGHIECHPADWNRHGRSAGFRRNEEMVDQGADICLAFILDNSPGASHTANLAQHAGIPVKMFHSTSAKAIDDFRGHYRFLSLFSPHPVLGANLRYPTAEAAFHAGKTTDPTMRAAIGAAHTPGEAKQLGRSVTLPPDWDEHRRHIVMREVLKRKFSNPDLATRLLATANAQLVEGNYWHDQFWGDCRCGHSACARPGQNWLGRYLMELRAELRKVPAPAAE